MEQPMSLEKMRTFAAKSLKGADNFIVLTFDNRGNKVDRHAFVNSPTATLAFLQYMNTLNQGMLQPPQPSGGSK